MAKKTQTLNTNLLIGSAVLAIVLIALVALFLQSSNQFGAGSPAPLKVVWNFNQQAQPSQASSPDSLELTVYTTTSNNFYGGGSMSYQPSSGIALVKEKRSANLPSGLTRLAVEGVTKHLDPTSVHFTSFTDPQSRVLEQDYDYDLVSTDKILERYLDQTITVRFENRTYTGKLLSVSPVLLLTTDGGVKIFADNPEIETLPKLPDGLLTKPTLTWLLSTTKPGAVQFELAYLTSGISWNAQYVAVIDKDAASLSNLKGWVSVTNGAGATFKDAQLKLMAGDVNLVQNAQPAYPVYETMGGGVRAAVAPTPSGAKQFTEQSLFEYRIYNLDRPTTLKDGETKQIELFNAANVKASKELVYDSTRSNQVRVNVEFENRKDAGLGLSMPAGTVRLYQPDSDGKLQFLGEDSIEHTPENEKVRLFVGNAFDLTAEREQTDYQQVSKCTQRVTNKIVLKNAKDTAAKVKVVEHAYGDWEIVRESQPHTKEGAYAFSYLLSIPAKGDVTLTYTIDQTYRYC